MWNGVNNILNGYVGGDMEMVIVVPPGDPDDSTRLPEIYDPTYEYLKSIGFPEIM